MLSCSRCGKEGGSLVGGGDLPGVLCLRCVEELGIELKWCECEEHCPECCEGCAREAQKQI
jgi:hypothetical protein